MNPAHPGAAGPRRGTAPRHGLTYLEVIVAMAVLGVTLSGLAVTIVTQLLLAEALEHRAYLIVPQSATLRLDEFDPRTGQFSAVYLLDESESDVVGPAQRWATRLGVAARPVRDARRDRAGTGRFPIEIGPRFTLQPGAPLEPYQRVQVVALDGGLMDDGAEVTTTAVLTPAGGS